MNIRVCVSLISAFLVALPLSASEQMTIIHAGQLLAIPGQEVLKKQSIVIRNSEIMQVRPGFLDAADIKSDSADVRIIDLANRFVLPTSCWPAFRCC